MEIELCRQIFENFSNIKFNENPFIGSLMRTDERTNRRNIDSRTT